MRLYFKYLTTQLKANFAYRGSALLNMFAQLASYVASILGIYLLFDRFKVLGDYSFYDILLTYSMIVFIFSFDEMIFRGFDEFDKLVNKGELDKLLIRPRNVVLQICGYKIETSKLFRVLLGIVLMVVACLNMNVEWTFFKVLILIEMLISGVITYFGVYLFTSCITIFTIEKAEFINIFTDGGRELCFYPLDIFKKFITRFFTFVIPFASFNYLPLRYILGLDSSLFNVIYPVFSIVFAFLGYLCFNFCLKFYKSVG